MALMFGGLLGAVRSGQLHEQRLRFPGRHRVDWSAYTGYGVVNTLIWAVCILLPLALMLVLWEKKMRLVLLFPLLRPDRHAGRLLVVSYLIYPRSLRAPPSPPTDVQVQGGKHSRPGP